ncbi:MAG: hypothetical protein DRN65_04945 [Thaumarchaeota archaeon]|nr:MAG: hypothetical protein DRN65_04945 [Nitrososphaerota archaeon]
MSSNAVQALKEEIWRRAREKAENILKNAEERAKKMIEAAETKAREELRSKIEPEKLVLKRRILGKAVMDGRKAVILAKNEVVEKAFEKALEKIRALTDSDLYREFLAKSLKKAIEEFSDIGGEELIVYANERDLEFLREKTRELYPSVKLKFRKGDFIGGIIVMDSAEKRVFYDTIESRFEALRPVLREKVASLLFKGGEEK